MARDKRGTAWWVAAATVLCAALLGPACGSAGAADSVAVSASTTGAAETDVALTTMFQDIAEQVAPMTVYGWAELPPGVSIAEYWWPVIETQSPQESGAGNAPNPHVTGIDSDQPQVQVVLRAATGWAVLVENFRGDLGDVGGKLVGEVGVQPANLYSVAGGRLVQWNDGGRWYGVFGRGLSDEQLVSLALGTQVISPGEDENRD